MKVDKVSDGTYRVRKMINGKTTAIYFDHKPSQKEVIERLAKEIEKPVNTEYVSDTFEDCIKAYLSLKSNILSPSTKRGYMSLINAFTKKFLSTRLCDIDNVTVQREINLYASNHSPKSVKNMYGLITIIMKTYRPSYKLEVQLPQKEKADVYIPTDKEVKAILDEMRGTVYYVPTCLAALGMRKSEIIAITDDDLDKDNVLTINKAMVKDENEEYVLKTTKTYDSTRKIYIPDDLAKLIRQQGYAYRGFPDNITRNLARVQKKLGIQHFPLHKLRHFFVTYAHNELHLSPEQIKDAGGWKHTSTIMETVYQHSMKEDEAKKKLAENIGKLF